MRTQRHIPILQNLGLILVAGTLVANAGTHYVNLNNPNPVTPYTSWASAATNIQDAVDSAVAGDEILVTNGVYQTGARAVYGMSNRVAVTLPVTVRSVNGPETTIIRGYQVPGSTNGAEAIRCVYLTNGAMLSGFTLNNGATQVVGDDYKQRSGGGAWCESVSGIVSNCVLTSNSANYEGGGIFLGTLKSSTLRENSASDGGGAYYSTLEYCTLTGNWAYNGGGTSGGTLQSCILVRNSAAYGGGASYGTLFNCTVKDNFASVSGGGVNLGTLYNCTLAGNSSISGGGASSGTLNNCTVTNNRATNGGGSSGGTLRNCTLTGNSAVSGGGTYNSSLNNCTITGNSANSFGGGAFDSSLNNCIVYYNNAFSGGNYFAGSLSYCCTTPLPSSGIGNIGAEPKLASFAHLSANSPCRGAGSAADTFGTDLDGEPWATPPSIGCDEYHMGSVTGAMTTSIVVVHTNVAVGFAVAFQGWIDGRVSASRWSFGDGVVVSNSPYSSHAWGSAGDYLVELRAYNESYPGGVATSVTVHVVDQPVHYVMSSNLAPAPPYNSWGTAATNIQAAVDAATLPGSLVMVSNGVYESGAVAINGASNRVAVARPVMVRSLNGPGVTIIRGYQLPGVTNGTEAIRCVYLTNGAMLTGFTITSGATQITGDKDQQQSGGGVWCESTSVIISNCVITANAANSSGGGAYCGSLYNCTLIGNSSGGQGGGAFNGTLFGCKLIANSTLNNGGGVSLSTLSDCILAGNSAYVYGGGNILWYTL